MLRVKFGELDEELSEIVDNLLTLSPQEYSRLILELSRQELLEQLKSNNREK